MTRKELDTLWQQALHESVVAGEDFIRYHFAALVQKAEREACAKVCDVEHEFHVSQFAMSRAKGALLCAAAIRARGNV